MKLLTLSEYASAMRISEETARRWCRDRKVGFIRVGRAYRFDPES
jgi:excisionase family DNA binding protein